MLYKLDSAKYERSFHPNLGKGTQTNANPPEKVRCSAGTQDTLLGGGFKCVGPYGV